MKRRSRHTVLYKLLGLAVKSFMMLLYGFLVSCVLVAPFSGTAFAYLVFRVGLSLFAQGGVILLCGVAIVALAESL
ncbi:MAG: exopolysaccharide biosynthesis protein [Cyanobacteria bacterium J06632_3]